MPSQSPGFDLVEGQLSSEEIFQVRGMLVWDWCDPTLLYLDVQGLTLGDRRYLGLDRGPFGFGCVIEFYGWLIYISGEDIQGNRCSSRGYLSQLICSLVVPSTNMVEFQPIELIFQAPNFVTMGLHFLVAAVRVLHDLVNNELRVATSVEVPNPKLDGDVQPIHQGLIFGYVV
jgi:hypothetical protein